MEERDELLLLGRCLRAAVDGPYFPDWEFHILMGLTRNEMKAIADLWPELSEDPMQGYESAAHAQLVAVNNATNNLLGYPHGVQQVDLEADLGGTATDIARALTFWRHEADFDEGPSGYFNRLM